MADPQEQALNGIATPATAAASGATFVLRRLIALQPSVTVSRIFPNIKIGLDALEVHLALALQYSV